MIQELPDPNSSLLDRLNDLTVAIRGLQDVPPEDKDAAEKLLDVNQGLRPNIHAGCYGPNPSGAI